jgi:hypothetical protein
MKYLIVAYRSRSMCKTYAVMHLKDQPLTWGPYKRLKRVKRIVADMRKERCIAARRGEDYKDHGPMWANVKIVEVEE